MQYDQYTTEGIIPYTTSAAVPVSAAPEKPAPPVQQEQKQPEEVVSEKPQVSVPVQADELPVVSKEERIEFRDENGRVLDEAEVKALEGKVSFKTRYETRTRIVDSAGNELHESLVDAREAEEQGVAPPHPDVEGRNPETKEGKEAEASELPPTVEAKEDENKEKSVEQQAKSPKPASEAKAATQESAN